MKHRFGTGQSLDPSVIVYADAHIVVVNKPAGLTTMRHPEEAAEFGPRAKRFLPATLADLLPMVLAKRPSGKRTTKGKQITDTRHGKPVFLRAVHRLDKETSGLVVFARTPLATRQLGQQFREHTIERSYLGVVRGQASGGRIESILIRDRGDGRRGSRQGAGQRAVTHVRVLEKLGGFTLVECRLETGRTHQVRIHLAEAGTPLCGERIYDRPVHGKPVPDSSGFSRPALHAASLGFRHPATGKEVRWSAPLPDDMARLIMRLRKARPGKE